ncbi:MAG: hypothetical protein M1821_002965 [Bathelium mastoideum]|nr:MAG: hypothetical protein M1821_002965 [Bathelium mastoideum]
MALPEKIKRQHFSKHEQALLTKQCEAVILDPADEAFLKSSRSTATAEVFAGNSTCTPAFCTHNLKRSVGSPLMPENGTVDPPTNHPGCPTSEMRLSELCDSPSQRQVCSRNSAHLVCTQSASIDRPGRGHTDTGNTRLAPLPPSPNICQSSTCQRAQAVYYRDVDVRKKLRLYLGSPQKFDEALEFGFPFAKRFIRDHAASLNSSSQRSSSEGQCLDNNLQRFLAGTQDSLSFLDVSSEPCISLEVDADGSDDDLEHSNDECKEPLLADDSSVSDLEDPRTPSTVCEERFEMVGPTPGHYLPSKKPSPASIESSAGLRVRAAFPSASHKSAGSQSTNGPCYTDKPLPPEPPYDALHLWRPHSADSYERGILSNREMTLRLTLTRPELRAPEEDIYGWQDDARHLPEKQQPKSGPIAFGNLTALVDDDDRLTGGLYTRKSGAVMKVWQLVGGK